MMEDVPPSKKAKIGHSPVEVEGGNNQFYNHQNGELSINGQASSEAGSSSNGPTSTHIEGPSSINSNSQESRSSEETGSTAGLSGTASPSGLPPGSSSPYNNQDDDDDNVSVLSGISDMSGKGWKPDMKGELAWLSRARAKGIDPRDIIRDLMQGGEADMLSSMDDNTIWMILFKMFAQPPKRQKLKDFNTLEDLAKHIKQAKKILVLTGAGVSVSCGIPDFRSKDGVYARLAVDFPDLPDPQAMFDIQYFRKDPRPFFKFAKEIYPGQFTPSPCHRFIQCLEREGKLLRNYTQNIDTLEQVAGISRVVQCHGSFATASCTVCTLKQDAETIRGDIMEQKIPLCTKCPSPDLQEILERLQKQQEERKERERKRMEEIKKMFYNPSGVELIQDQGDKQTEKGDCSTKGEDDNEPSNHEKSKEDNICDPGAGSSQTCQPSTSKQVEGESTSSSNTVPPPSNLNPISSPPSHSLLPKPEPVSQFSNVPIMKPDIVFFGEGLSDQFHKTISQDKDEVDLLIVIGSSLKVRPVALIPSSIPKHVPQVLINRERLSHLTFDVELLGDCDVVINQLCHMLEGDWSPGIHKPVLEQTLQLTADDSTNDDSNVDQGAKDTSVSTAVESAKDASVSAAGESAKDATMRTGGESAKDATMRTAGESAKDATVSAAGESAKNDSELNKSTNDSSVKESDTKDTTEKSEVSATEGSTAANAEASNLVEDPATNATADGFNDLEDDDEEESGEWKPRSLAEILPSHQFLHIPPHRYVFSGAEVFAEDFSDDDDEIESDSDPENDQQGELDTSNEESLNQTTQSDNQDPDSSSTAPGSNTKAPGLNIQAPGTSYQEPSGSSN